LDCPQSQGTEGIEVIGNHDHAGPKQSAANRQSHGDYNGKPAKDDRHEPGTPPWMRMIVLHAPVLGLGRLRTSRLRL
jgi:hypothetical protein